MAFGPAPSAMAASRASGKPSSADGQTASQRETPSPTIRDRARAGRDEHECTGLEARDALGTEQIDRSFEDEERLSSVLVAVGRPTLAGIAGYDDDAPATRFARARLPNDVEAGERVATARPDHQQAVGGQARPAVHPVAGRARHYLAPGAR